MKLFDKYGPVTLVLLVTFTIAAIAGALVTLINPDGLSFQDYLDALAKLAGTLGLLAIGRGVHASATRKPPYAPPERIPLGVAQGNAAAGENVAVFLSGGVSSGPSQDGPGDEDALPHIEPTNPSDLPPDPEQEAQPMTSTDQPRGVGYSGLSAHHRAKAKSAILAAINLSFAHSGNMEYTQGGSRWSGIANKLNPRKGEYPRLSDCSSWYTWLLWSALFLLFQQGDRVNGQHWKAGFTGTLLQHGKTVVHQENWRVGDAIIYGIPGTTGKHVAVYIGGGFVASHGSAGIHKLPWNYRSDFMVCKRYI